MEVKAQVAWDYTYNDSASAFVNTTWDLDQLSSDFPYTEKSFNPWGGGNVNVQISL